MYQAVALQWPWLLRILINLGDSTSEMLLLSLLQLTTILAALVASGLMPLTALLITLSAKRLAPFLCSTSKLKVNHLLIAVIQQLEQRTTVKTVQMQLENLQKSASTAAGTEVGSSRIIPLTCELSTFDNHEWAQQSADWHRGASAECLSWINSTSCLAE